ncbi:hypothetical protein OEV98_03295 [Caldibacillus lycopersici]|uniref:Uncharacterized protein n=1 Tax=Perspicuibacillus lycopersici TaxID=1325689 RepID=A0AAE3IS19_9BACI|nr:hypothetical protein [Perspicuibacillus lycopersici]MCU9612588.1 hypothetical protein [Perspicuibacillus lycopersici]
MAEAIAKKLEQLFKKDVKENIKLIKDLLGGNADFASREFILHPKENLRAVCFFTEGLTNTQEVENAIRAFIYGAPKLMDGNTPLTDKAFAEWVKIDVLFNFIH